MPSLTVNPNHALNGMPARIDEPPVDETDDPSGAAELYDVGDEDDDEEFDDDDEDESDDEE
jgi:hypothetical protein